MEKINIKAGQNYKVTHKKTNAVHFMNAQEVADFILNMAIKIIVLKI